MCLSWEMDMEILVKLHNSASKFTPVYMRDEKKVIHQALQLRGLGMERYDISAILNVNQYQVRQWLEEKL